MYRIKKPMLLIAIIFIALSTLYGCSSGGNCNLQTGSAATATRILTLDIRDHTGAAITDVAVTVDHPEYFVNQPHFNSEGKLVYELSPSVPNGAQIEITLTKPGWYFDPLVLVVGEGTQITHPNGYDGYPAGTVEIPRVVTGYEQTPAARYFDLDIRNMDEVRIADVTYQVTDHPEYITDMRIENGHFIYNIAPNVPDGASFTISFQKNNYVFENLIVYLDGNRTINPDGSTTFSRVQYGYIPLGPDAIKQISTWRISSAHFCTYSNGIVTIPQSEGLEYNDKIGHGFYLSINGQGGPVIAKMDAKGEFTIFAGLQRTNYNPLADGPADYATGTNADDGIGTNAKFGSPNSLAISSDSRYLYVTDFVNYEYTTIPAAINGFYVEGPISGTTHGPSYGPVNYGNYIKKMARVRKIDTTTKEVTTLVDFHNILGSYPKSMAGLALSNDNATLYVGVGYAIYEVDTSNGAATVFAGTYNTNGNGNGTTATASFEEICDLALSPDGNTIYAYEFAHVGVPAGNFDYPGYYAHPRGQIRKITAGNVTTLVDTTKNLTRKAIGGYMQEGCGVGLVISADGNTLYATDAHSVARIDANSGEVTTVFGERLTEGETDDYGTDARISFPHGLALLPNGDSMLMFEDRKHYVRNLNLTTTKVETLFGGTEGLHNTRPGYMTMEPLAYPMSMCFSKNGQYIFIADAGTIDSTPYARILSYNADTDTLTQLWGSKTATGTSNTGSGTFTTPADMAMSPDNSTIYILDTGANNIRAINRSTNVITTPFNSLSAPKHLDISPDGNTLYVTDANDIKAINTGTWSSTTVLSLTSPNEPFGIVVSEDGNTLYFTTAQDDTNTNGGVFSVPSTGGTPTLVSNGTATGSSHILNINSLNDIAISTNGNYLYVAEKDTMVTGIEISSGKTFKLAGNVQQGYRSGGSDNSRFRDITNIIKYPGSDLLFVCDLSNSMIRRILAVE